MKKLWARCRKCGTRFLSVPASVAICYNCHPRVCKGVKVLGIDPGVNAVGWVLAQIRENNGMPKILAGGVAKASRDAIASKNKLNKAMSCAYGVTAELVTQSRMYNLLEDKDAITIAVEWPELRSDATSMAAASKGDLQFLALMVGTLVGSVQTRWLTSRKVNLYKPSEWKGQLSKETTTRRMARYFGDPIVAMETGSVISSHAADALGVAMHDLGLPMDHSIWRKR